MCHDHDWLKDHCLFLTTWCRSSTLPEGFPRCCAPPLFPFRLVVGPVHTWYQIKIQNSAKTMQKVSFICWKLGEKSFSKIKDFVLVFITVGWSRNGSGLILDNHPINPTYQYECWNLVQTKLNYLWLVLSCSQMISDVFRSSMMFSYGLRCF